MMEKSCIGREPRKGWATPAASPPHDTVLNRYRVAAGVAQALRDSLPMHDFSIIHDYRMPRGPFTRPVTMQV